MSATPSDNFPNLEQEDVEICIQHLMEIGKAFKAYQEEHGDIPKWLSDLYPEYLKDEKLLICPADEKLGDPETPYFRIPSSFKDPSLPVSYFYDRVGLLSMKRHAYGDVVPIVRCHHHKKDGKRLTLNLSCAFEVYPSRHDWDREPRVLESLLATTKKYILAGDLPEGKSNVYTDYLSNLTQVQKKELVAFAQETIQSQPGNGTAYKVFGALRFMEWDRSEETLAALEKAMPLLPKDAETHYYAGMLFDQFYRSEEAIKAFEVAFQLPVFSTFFPCYLTLCKLYVQAGRDKDADELINRFRSVMRSSYPSDCGILWDMLILVKRDQEAIQLFEDLSEKHPNETYYLRKLVDIHEAMGNKELAKEYRLKLGKIDPVMAMVGEIVPDFEATDLDGRPISLKDYRGKVVLLDFWAVWCGPCRAEMPNVKKVYDKYRDKGFEIIGISLDTDESKLRAYIKDNDIKWRQVFSGKGWDSPVSRKYGIRAIPAPWLIGKDGRLIWPRARGEDLERMVVEALKKGDVKIEFDTKQ